MLQNGGKDLERTESGNISAKQERKSGTKKGKRKRSRKKFLRVLYKGSLDCQAHVGKYRREGENRGTERRKAN